MQFLVTGGCGYIGSHLLWALKDAGHEAVVFDLPGADVASVPPGMDVERGDVQDGPRVREVMAGGFDGVFHLAALKSAGDSMTVPETYSSVNIAGTINVLNAMVEHEVPMIFYSSSATVYAPEAEVPLTEDSTLGPDSYYGYTKLAGEQLIGWYGKLHGIKYGILRYFNAAGYDPQGRVTTLEKDPKNLIPVVMEVLQGAREELLVFGDDYETRDGTGIRDYIHVSDLADAHVKVAEYVSENESVTLNLGTEQGVSVLEMVKAAEDVSGRKVPYRIVERRPGDLPVSIASSAQARELLSWTPEHSGVRTIVETTWNAYRA